MGGEDIVSIMLDELASCGIVHTSHPVLLLIAAAAAGLAFLAGAGNNNIFEPLIVVTVVCLIAYFLTRRHVLAIASAGHTIRAPLAGMTTDGVMRIIEAAERAKNDRYYSRANVSAA